MSIQIEKLLEQETSYYRLVLLAARRANELAEGAQPLVASQSKKVGITALNEIENGKVYTSESVKSEKGKKNGKAKKAKE